MAAATTPAAQANVPTRGSLSSMRPLFMLLNHEDSESSLDASGWGQSMGGAGGYLRDSVPDLIRRASRAPNATRLPTGLARQLDATLDISPAAVGPNTARQAQLAIYASRRKAGLWLEDEQDSLPPCGPGTLRLRQETSYSICRRYVQKWARDKHVNPNEYEWMMHKPAAVVEQEKKNKRRGLSVIHGDKNPATGKRGRHPLEAFMEEYDAAKFADRNANLTASCIGLADNAQGIQWEKRRMLDLIEKERLIPRNFALQREINDLAIEIKNQHETKTAALARIEAHRKQREIVEFDCMRSSCRRSGRRLTLPHDTLPYAPSLTVCLHRRDRGQADTVLVEFFLMIKRFNDRRAEAERQAEYRRESSATMSSHGGNGSSFHLRPGKHGHSKRLGGGHHAQGRMSTFGFSPHLGAPGSGMPGGERRASVLMPSRDGSSNFGSSILGSQMIADSAGTSAANLSGGISTNSMRSRRSSHSSVGGSDHFA
ncbi:hypothetical protein HK105_200112 [Polyrhizophydium stewartii]|uniref:Uncharacterized protein n=1 Tax=Polyrhizophydium stewartii TaxID=2732419 RepID=A0ABR4NKK1_9FUNG